MDCGTRNTALESSGEEENRQSDFELSGGVGKYVAAAESEALKMESIAKLDQTSESTEQNLSYTNSTEQISRENLSEQVEGVAKESHNKANSKDRDDTFTLVSATDCLDPSNEIDDLVSEAEVDALVSEAEVDALVSEAEVDDDEAVTTREEEDDVHKDDDTDPPSAEEVAIGVIVVDSPKITTARFASEEDIQLPVAELAITEQDDSTFSNPTKNAEHDSITDSSFANTNVSSSALNTGWVQQCNSVCQTVGTREPPKFGTKEEVSEHYVIHHVSRDDSLASLALKYNIASDVIRRINFMTCDRLQGYPVLRIPRTRSDLPMVVEAPSAQLTEQELRKRAIVSLLRKANVQEQVLRESVLVQLKRERNNKSKGLFSKLFRGSVSLPTRPEMSIDEARYYLSAAKWDVEEALKVVTKDLTWEYEILLNSKKEKSSHQQTDKEDVAKQLRKLARPSTKVS